MTWAELYSEAARPTLEEIDAYAHTPLWPQLRAYLAAAYGAGPRLVRSGAGMECEVPQGQQVSLHGLPAAWVCDGHGFCRAQG